MARAVTTLGLQGIVTEPIQKMNILLKAFYASDELQSSLTPVGTVKSLPKLVLKHKPGPDLENAVQTALQDLFTPYFDDVDVKVKISLHPNNPADCDIGVTLKVYQDGIGYDSVDTRSVKDNIVDLFG